MRTKISKAVPWICIAALIIACGFVDVTSQYGPSQNTQINAALTLQQSEMDALSAAGVGGTLAADNLIVGNDSTNATAMPVIGDVTVTQDGTNVTTLIASGVIVNADVSGSAAIAYSKLNLTTNIVNADVGASAAIALTKLAAGYAFNGTAASTITVEYGTCTNGETVVFANTFTSVVYANIEDQHATSNAYFSAVTTTNGTAVVPGALTNKYVIIGLQ